MNDLGELWRKILKRDFHIYVITNGEDRNQVIWNCKEIINQKYGNILDFKMFSNLSINFNIEIKSNLYSDLINTLKQQGWKVEFDPKEEAFNDSEAKLMEGTLQITFPEGDGTLKQIIPAVPG